VLIHVGLGQPLKTSSAPRNSFPSPIRTRRSPVFVRLCFRHGVVVHLEGKASARAWGIIASLVTMYIPLSLTYFFHSPFSNSIYKAIVFSFLALIAYLWPEKQADETLHAQEEDDITSHR
jgi:hypothetical protein